MTVAQEGSFTKAASVLGVSQPAVSQNIAELEKACGVKLFARQRSEVILTPQGRIFSRYAARILGAYSETERLFTPLQQASVRISVSEDLYAFIIGPALEEFRTVHPEITFERVLSDRADIVISLSPSPATPFERHPDRIATIRTAMSAEKETGGISATRESIRSFDLLYSPSPAFACMKLCRLLEEFLKSSIS